MVAPSVGGMSYQRLAYDDLDSVTAMSADCVACGAVATPALTTTAVGPVPSTPDTGSWTDFPRDVRKPEITVSAAAAHLAAALHLHLD